jgi:hypothetical protein
MKKTGVTLLTICALALSVMLTDSANAETRLFVPHFSSGPQQETQLLLVNSNEHESRIDLWAFTPDGHLAGQSQVTVPGNSTRSLTLKEAFQLSEPLSGWLGAVSNDDGIGLSYSLSGDRDGISTTESHDAVAWTSKVFHETLANAKRQTVGISNPNAFPAQVIVNGLDPDDRVVARRAFTLAPFAQIEQGVENLIGSDSVRLDMLANADVVATLRHGSPPIRRAPRKPAAMTNSHELALVVETSSALGAYQVTLQFDPQVVQLSAEDVAGGLAEGFESRPLVVNVDNATGRITLASFQVGSHPTGRMTVARISFSTRAAPASPFLVHVDEVTNSAGQSLDAAEVAVSLARLK